MIRLLLIDDEQPIREGIRARLAHAGLVFDEVLEASDGLEALDLLQAHPCDIVLSDIRMPRLGGLELLREMKRRGMHARTILFSGHADFAYAREAITLGVVDYLLKPVSETELADAVRKAAAAVRTERESAIRTDAGDNTPAPSRIALPHAKLRLLLRHIEDGEVEKLEPTLRSIYEEPHPAPEATVFAEMVGLEIVELLVRETGPVDDSGRRSLEHALVGDEVVRAGTPREQASAACAAITAHLGLERHDTRGTARAIRQAMEYIEAHSAEEISPVQLAQRAAMSPGYFTTLFRRECGQTVVGHIAAVRIRNACRLLSETNASVAEIAQAVGYDDPQYFFRVFKKATGMTPLEHRAAHVRGDAGVS